MATNNFKPGSGRFASGDKFKGRGAAAGDNNSNRTSRNFNPDDKKPAGSDRPFRERSERPNREDRTSKFKDEGKKVYNRSERFTRNEEGQSRPSRPEGTDRSDNRASFKSGPKFNKPATFKGGNRSGEGSDRGASFNRERGERSERKEDRTSDRPRYGERRNDDKKDFAPRGERKGGAGETRKPYGEKRDFNQDKRSDFKRPERGSDDRRERTPRENRNSDSERPARNSEDRPFNNRSRSTDSRKPESRDRKPFTRTKTEETKEAPNYDLKRYQARERRKDEVKSKDKEGLIRLNRYIANAGICSRREADTLIASGEIKVNGQIITEMGYMVKPEDTVTYGKKRLNREKMVYVLLNKPKDFITTTEDPEGRKTVMDLVSNASKERIFPVGRLDRNTTGLLLFTNDGELAQKLTHPSNNISKIYQVELDKPVTKEHFEMITAGLELEDGKAVVDDLAIIGDTDRFLGIQIHIGRNRIVRRIFEHLGYEVVSLDRVQYAGLTKKDLPRSKWRFLDEKEVIRLKYFL